GRGDPGGTAAAGRTAAAGATSSAGRTACTGHGERRQAEDGSHPAPQRQSTPYSHADSLDLLEESGGPPSGLGVLPDANIRAARRR
ncbi:MAG: hypothetical protein J2P33_12195, partial [Actinobacteria bacterium]|nr:hypothetical protein [Actinomycetota bacterium]